MICFLANLNTIADSTFKRFVLLKNNSVLAVVETVKVEVFQRPRV